MSEEWPEPVNPDTLERLTYCVRSLASDELGVMIDGNVDGMRDIIGQRIYFTFRQHLWCLPDDPIRFPADWWQHFRLRWLPAWWLRRYPVRWHEEKKYSAVYLSPGGKQVLEPDA